MILYAVIPKDIYLKKKKVGFFQGYSLFGISIFLKQTSVYMKNVLMPTPQLHRELSGQLSYLHSFHCSTFPSPWKIEQSQNLEGEAGK